MLRCLLGAVVMAALLLPGHSSAAGRPQASYRLGLIRQDNVKVYSQPSAASRPLVIAVQQTQVEVVGTRGSWSHIELWATVRGWVESKELVFRKPWESVSTYRAPEVRYHVHVFPSQSLQAEAHTTAPTTQYTAPGGTGRGTLPAGARVVVSAWQQDRAGKIWYRIGGLWSLGDSVQFETPDPGLARRNGVPLWKRVGGKGMWLTLGTIADSEPEAIVNAALRNGLTHLYLESAISPLGFHGKSAVGPLLDAAHRHHVAVIAWVYPYLYDLASDVGLTRQVAAFHTPSGQRFDGIAADLEQNVYPSTLRAYSQLVRAYLGPAYLLVGVTYPPQSFPAYPFSEVAHDYNLIAPMDYWHQTKSRYGLDYGHMPYGYNYGFRYASDSVATIRRLSGSVPVAPIGQTFDNFGRLEMGPYAPSAQEVTGFLAGSRTSGAVGASFFQWMTAEVEEWHAIHDFRF